MAMTEVADGVYRFSDAYVNFYIIEGDDGLTLIDSGLPSMWLPLEKSLRAVGHTLRDIRALVLTHAHFDHLGLARRLHESLSVPVWVHTEDSFIAKHPYRYRHERSRFVFALTHPKGLPVMASMTRAGALNVKGVDVLSYFPGTGELPVPGSPEVVFSPGHTSGHCGLFLRERSILFSGDALVTMDPYTMRTGPRIVAGAATADSALNLASLKQLAATKASLVLPGHGEPWARGIEEAVAIAKANGPA
ncbi:MBL fold metallo-hydrolase [Arthrobacter sp. fls2-241-R2A-200]|uniref:MBL fold metallo-hydrolase n=1 Tax=Arthrobacter sp. fls2-241-R2A-200 TaxID=3040281 RepID=UPI00254AF312|nr:MBL fold metallo-hydrolase [Arthrobacter sp. fls2-241-R2A-200]